MFKTLANRVWKENKYVLRIYITDNKKLVTVYMAELSENFRDRVAVQALGKHVSSINPLIIEVEGGIDDWWDT